jgi:hypothetical protein
VDSVVAKINQHSEFDKTHPYTKSRELQVSTEKTGYVVFFSSIFENTVCIEVKSFCLPYDEVTWQGKSDMYLLVFNDSLELTEYYVGERKYN